MFEHWRAAREMKFKNNVEWAGTFISWNEIIRQIETYTIAYIALAFMMKHDDISFTPGEVLCLAFYMPIFMVCMTFAWNVCSACIFNLIVYFKEKRHV